LLRDATTLVAAVHRLLRQIIRRARERDGRRADTQTSAAGRRRRLGEGGGWAKAAAGQIKKKKLRYRKNCADQQPAGRDTERRHRSNSSGIFFFREASVRFGFRATTTATNRKTPRTETRENISDQAKLPATKSFRAPRLCPPPAAACRRLPPPPSPDIEWAEKIFVARVRIGRVDARE
jgi:hypothetical protein